MATHSNSNRSFLSSSPTKYGSGPWDEVEELLAQAQTVDRLDPRIESFITTNRNNFFMTFARQVNLIRSRSQAFQVCHVTVFDKVLLELTQNGANLENAAAIHYFCEEFLAIPTNTSGIQKTSILTSALAASVLRVPAVTPPNTYQGSSSTRDNSREPVGHKSTSDHVPRHDSTLLDTLTINIGPAMPRMWSVYSQAKRDFLADAGQDDKKQHNVAKFLRDTAENILQYLEGKDVDRRLVDELQASLQVAEEAVTILHGGKKRKFDDPRATEDLECTQPTRKRHDTERNNRRYGRNRESLREVVRGDFPGHTQALTQHQRSRYSDHGRRNAVTELFPDVSEPKRKRKNQTPRPQPGRGHSDIPFGYSRPVDSYQPGR